MNKSWQIINNLELDNSRLAKEAIIRHESISGNDEFFAGANLALNSFITFGVKKVTEKSEDSGEGLDWQTFATVVDNLITRKITGHDALDTIGALKQLATKEQWNGWYRRILIKDLRCGVGEKTINTVVGKSSKYLIPVFECQLAHDSANHETKVIGLKHLEVKLDGVRVITIAYPNGKVEMFSRNGKELINFEHIASEISQVIIKKGIAQAMVYDGEVMSSSFQDLMRQVHRKSDVVAKDAILNLFDILTLEEFKLGGSLVPQFIRSDMIQTWVEENKDTLAHVQSLDWVTVNLDSPEGQQTFKEVNKRAVDGGYEGIMIKDPKAGYECKRSTSWLKLKPFIEVSLTIVGIEEGTGRNQGRLGAFICEGEDDGKNIRVNVGSGFSDSDRESFWRNKTDCLNKLVEIRADATTKSQESEETWSLRFPRFLKFRGFELNEKL